MSRMHQPPHPGAVLGQYLEGVSTTHATAPSDLSAPSWKLHPLKGNLQGHWAITVNGNWRLTFRFIGQDVELLDYQDYH